MNAKSVFTPPTKRGGGGVLETTRRFQIASPASHSPGLSPTRGSERAALGALPALAATVGAEVVVTGVWAHPAALASAAPASTQRPSEERVRPFGTRWFDVISCFEWWDTTRVGPDAITLRRRRWGVQQASSACARSRTSDP